MMFKIIKIIFSNYIIYIIADKVSQWMQIWVNPACYRFSYSLNFQENHYSIKLTHSPRLKGNDKVIYRGGWKSNKFDALSIFIYSIYHRAPYCTFYSKEIFLNFFERIGKLISILNCNKCMLMKLTYIFDMLKNMQLTEYFINSLHNMPIR